MVQAITCGVVAMLRTYNRLVQCRRSTRESCDSRCETTEGCECSYYGSKSKFCTLMQKSGACRNFDSEPEALAYDLDPSTKNDVTLQCGPNAYAYYYE